MAFEYTDDVFSTALIKSIVRRKPKDVKELLDRGFSANLQDNRGWTPLHHAAQDDERCACLQELLSHKSANINSQTFQGETPLFIACLNNSLQIAREILVKHKNCNVDQANSEAVSPLHIACNKGNKQIVKLLVEFGSNINSQDFNGYTPLHEVCQTTLVRDNRDEIALQLCKYLTEHGAHPGIAENEGNFPFHFACQNSLLRCANFLVSVSKYCDVINLCNFDGQSPLMMAVTSKSLPMIESLLSQGANPNVADNTDVTALHLAAHSANYHIFDMIHKAMNSECILKYCTFNKERVCQLKRINSLICLAIDTEDIQFLVSVLDSGFDNAVLHCPIIHAENSKNKYFTLHTPISFLLESKMCDLGDRTLDFLDVLISKGSPLKVTGDTSLFNYIDPICATFVAMNDCSVNTVMRCLKHLLEHGADPDEPHGRMPYSMEQACMRGCTDAVLLLLQYTNVLVAEDVLTWIEHETSSGQLKTVEALLPLSPYYTPSDKLLADLKDSPDRTTLLTPQVFSLASYCRTIMRRQLRSESLSSSALFKEKLSQLKLPINIYNFLRYM